MAYLSAGVYIKEVDNSAIVPTVSNSVAFFSGDFTKGVIEQPFVITNKEELEFYFGQPTNENYNGWFQCYKFFDYSNQLVVSRAFTEGNAKVSDIKTLGAVTDGTAHFNVATIDGLYKGTKFNFENFSSTYEISSIQYQSNNSTYLLSLVNPTDPGDVPIDTALVIHGAHLNAGGDCYRDYLTSSNDGEIVPDFNQNYMLIKNDSDFEVNEDTIPFNEGVKLRFFAKTAGSVNGNIEVAVCNSYDFDGYYDNTDGIDAITGPSRAEAFEGVPLRAFFDYPPTGNQIGVVIRQGEITESYVCSFNENAVDGNNKSMYIENVINENSSMVYVVQNGTLGLTPITDYSHADLSGEYGSKTYDTYINSYIYRNSQDVKVGDSVED